MDDKEFTVLELFDEFPEIAINYLISNLRTEKTKLSQNEIISAYASLKDKTLIQYKSGSDGIDKGEQIFKMSDIGRIKYLEEKQKRDAIEIKNNLEDEFLRGQVEFQDLNNKAIKRQLELMESQTTVFTKQTEIQATMKQFTRIIVLLTVVVAAGTIVSEVLLINQPLCQALQELGSSRASLWALVIEMLLILLAIMALNRLKLFQELLKFLKGNE